MNMDPRGKQPHLRDGWYYLPNGVTLYSQEMSFDQADFTIPAKWRGLPTQKGCKRILQECSLWPEGGMRHDCKGKKCKKDRSHIRYLCCARRLLSVQPDFLEQKSRLQDEIEKRGHLCLFFPKYHSELN